MVFGNISTLYFPVAANAGASQWGTDVRKLLDAADAASDVTTVNNHGTGGAVTRTADPYTTSAADSDQTLFGWAVTPSDMNSVAGARRYYPAGNHVLTARIANGSLAAENITTTLFVYRVGPSPTRTRTLLGSASSVTNIGINLTATVTVTVALAAITFAADETIQYSIETTAPGLGVTGRSLQIITGTNGGVAVRVDTPQLGTLFGTTLSAVMDGTATMLRKISKTLSVVMDGTPTLVRHFTGFKVLSVVMDGSPVMVRVVKKPITTVMNGIPSLVRKMVKILPAVMDGSPTLSKKTTKTLTVVMDGTPTLLRLATVGRTLSVVMDGSPVLARAVTVARTLSAVMNGMPFGFVKFPWGSLPECPEDWSPNDGLKSIAGDVFFHEPPNEGDPVIGATVTLIRDSDRLRIDTTTTDGAGHYSFPRDTNDPYTYHVEVRYADQQGLSEGGCVPV